MSSMNRVILIGRVGRKPDIRTFSSGGQVANFSLATGEKWNDRQTGEKKEKTDWHNVAVMSENLISVVERFVDKGSLIGLEGKLETRKWQDQNGNDRYSTEVVLRPFDGKLQLLGGKGEGQQAPSSTQGQVAALERVDHDLDDDIPF